MMVVAIVDDGGGRNVHKFRVELALCLPEMGPQRPLLRDVVAEGLAQQRPPASRVGSFVWSSDEPHAMSAANWLNADAMLTVC